ncbi:MAG TPA: IPT/TIG domain-containing protein [Candidatus Angelobacter sp.]|nr:IPT/TIG domain-containing protein [Candidatus Angelobacter sp.]
MGRLRHSVPILLLLSFVSACAGCGGGASLAPPPPPPPAPDFSLGLSANSVSVSQGSTSPAVTVSVTAENGFTGNVQVTLSGLPAGVSSNPTSPFTIAAGASTAVVFGAAANAATGSFTVSVQGTSGALSHPQNLSLAVQSAVAAVLPRTSYARSDATPAADAPSGEPHHRHIVYDSTHKQIFVANRAMNRVEVFSSASQSRTAQIAVSGASSADLSADGATLWVGTALDQVVAVDPVSLAIARRYTLAGLTPIPNTIFNRPVEALALSNGKLMVRLRQPVSPEALLALWDPASNSLTNLTPAAPAVFQQGVGVLARSGDHSKVLAAANDASGEVAVFDSGGNVVAGPATLGTGTIPWLAANVDGSRYAAVLVSGGATQLLLLNASLSPFATYSAGALHGVTFSRDGKKLYVSETLQGAPVITVLDGQTGQLLGRAPDAAIQGVSSEIEDADETQLLFALSNRGLSFLDASAPGHLPPVAPSLAAAPSATPSEGPITGGTAVVLNGQNFTSLAQLNFGSQSASNAAVSSPAQIQANSPASVVNGPVNLTAYFQNSWLALAPDAFSYGPQILQILPNAGTAAGGDSVQIYGYGFGSDATKITVKIGGASATVQRVENVANFAASLGLDASYPFPLERITLQTPAGASGKADVNLAAPAGSTTAAKSFQYLQSVNSFSKPALFKFLIYDQARQRIDLANIDHVDVFDLQQKIFLSPIDPPGGPPPNAGLRGLALTPDGSQLVVADFGAQNVYLLDPVKGTGTTVSVGGVPGFTNSGPARVAATSTQTVFVGLSGEGGSGGACSTCLAQMNLTSSPPTIQPAPQPEVTSLTGAPLIQSNAAGDQVFLAFASAPGGPLALWNASSPNHFVTSAANASAVDLGTAPDGTMFVLQTNGATEVHAADLSLASVPAAPQLAQIPGRVLVPGLTLHPSGALLYQPFLTGAPGSAGVKGGVDIVDAHSGVLRLRIFLPQQFMTDTDALHGSFLAIDENGQRLFAITSSDGTPQNGALTIVQLAAVPLGIGTIQPPIASVAGGTTLTLRGSGFVNGTQVTFNGKSAAVTFKDANTLSVVTPSVSSGPQRVTLTNPDGEAVSLDAAITAN